MVCVTLGGCMTHRLLLWAQSCKPRRSRRTPHRPGLLIICWLLIRLDWAGYDDLGCGDSRRRGAACHMAWASG